MTPKNSAHISLAGPQSAGYKTMMAERLINLESQDLAVPIYRVYDIQRLLEIYTLNMNTLVKPEKWDDPFENFILKVAIKESGSADYYISVKDGFFGQCWSTLKESDAMWRIYSPTKSGVKVKTSIGKLFKSLDNAPENKEKRKKKGLCFIGRVSYKEDEILRENLQDKRWLDAELADTKSQATSLLFKRFEFAHEKEVRLLYLPNLPYHQDSKIFRYTVKPLSLFDEIQFDPRITDELFKVYKHYLRSEIGFRKPVTKSKLYEVPNLL
jgi:hypothetical protein